MRLLVDTNIFLEVLLQQERTDEASAILRRYNEHTLHITDFSLHTIGLILISRNRHQAFMQFLEDILDAGITVSTLESEELRTVIEISNRYRLDFDDAYQYAVAEKLDLTIISFDGDFDATDRGRRMPADFI